MTGNVKKNQTDIQARKFKVTFGKCFKQAPGTWKDQRELTWEKLGAILTDHKKGSKDGPCIVPAILRKPERKSEYADEISLLALDSDCGYTLQEIASKVVEKGYAAIIYSTHSHLTTKTTVARTEFESRAVSAEQYLIRFKGYLPHVAKGAHNLPYSAEDADVVIEHQTCSKYRIVLSLDRPWRAPDFESQETAIMAWKERYHAAGEHLGLLVDPACSDPNRLFFLPRHQQGARFETRIIKGSDIGIWELPSPQNEVLPPAETRKCEKHLPSEDEDIIGVFNRTYSAEALLEKYGYRRIGNKYLAPTSSTKEPGVSVKDGRAFSFHSSDRLFTGGMKGDHGHDAFSIFRIWEHDGNLKEAVKAAARLLNIGVKQTSPKLMSYQKVFPLTDFGNAERFSAQHNEKVRFCHTWGKWLLWNGAKWEIDETTRVYQLAKETVRGIYTEASQIEDDEKRKAVSKHARSSESSGRVQAMLSLAQTEQIIATVGNRLDSDPWLLNVLNGTLDLRTGNLLPHQRENLITKIAPVNYDPAAVCPQWFNFLDRIMAGSVGLISYLQKLSGYCLTGDTREKCLPVLHGIGDNGKTIFTATIGAMLGDYAQETPVETLMIKKQENIPNDIARLKGARLVTASEGERGQRLAESLIKRLTGGDKISARFLHQEWFEFTPEFKIWLSTNHRPIIRGSDNAIWNRIHLVPFEVIIPKSEQIPRTVMLEQLRNEWPGILRWAVEGCLLWQKEGIQKPEEVERATEDYRADSDLLGGFVTECCTVNPLGKGKTADLYCEYERWCSDNKEEAMTQRHFISILQERGFKKTRVGAAGARGFQGIGLKSDTDTLTHTDTVLGVFPIEKNQEEKKGKTASASVSVSVEAICSDCADFRQNPNNPSFQGHCLGNPPDGERLKFPNLKIDCPEFRERDELNTSVPALPTREGIRGGQEIRFRPLTNDRTQR